MEDNTAPETAVSDNALTSGYTPEQSAAPVEQGQAPQESSWTSGFSEDFKGLIDKKGLSKLSQQEATEALAKSYTNLESMRNIPTESLFNLSKDMSDEARNKAYDALGRPPAANQYSYKAQDTDNAELIETFLGESHKLGLTDKQASNLIPALNEKIVAISQAHTEQLQVKNNDGLSALQKEWGGAWEANKNMAVRAAEHFGVNEEMQVAMRDSANSAPFLKLLHTMGSMMSEGGMAGMSPQSGSAAMGVMTPGDAKAEINSRMSNPEFMSRFHSQTQSIREAAAKELAPFRKASLGK